MRDRHVVLLGDSIFDNAPYVGTDLDVVHHLVLRLEGSRTTLLAVDGSTTVQLGAQIEQLPPDATDIFVSIGGNDAILSSSILEAPSTSVAHSLRLLAATIDEFEASYRSAIAPLFPVKCPVTLCTIYEGYFPDPDYRRTLSTALSLFNDRIIRVAAELGAALLDLRPVCHLPEHFIYNIEPSVLGGSQIADAIAALALGRSTASSTAA